MTRFKVEWIDSGHEPQCPADPRYPNGIDVEARPRALISCRLELPYPAPRCGRYHIECNRCGLIAIVTTAGRRDDPRSVRLGCRMRLN